MNQQLDILHEDEDLIIVNKPSNFLTIPDRFAHDLPSILGSLRQTRPEVFTVHRLDKDTSGIICFAKNSAAHRHLSQQFENRTVKKIYWALVEGRFIVKEGAIDKPIAQNMRDSARMIVAKRGKPSLTLYHVVEEFKHYSLVEAEIKTGRTHQVRVHFQSHGNPLAVDALYGNHEAIFLSQIKGQQKYRQGKFEEEKPLMSRTTLHAYELQLQHPTTLEIVTFQAPLHKDFAAVLNQLRKWGK